MPAPCPAAILLPAELLEPPPGTAKKVLEAHRILVTARSLRSVDSSISHTTDNTDAAGCRASPATVRFMQDAVPIKCLLLRALVAALPLLESAGRCTAHACTGTPGIDSLAELVLLCRRGTSLALLRLDSVTAMRMPTPHLPSANVQCRLARGGPIAHASC